MPRGAFELGPLDQQVMLAVLRLHPDGYGLSIQKEIQTKTGKEHSIGAIYASLDRLLEKGFVKDRQGAPTAERGGRRKMHFTLTTPGQIALKQSLNEIAALRRGVRWKEVPA